MSRKHRRNAHMN